LGVSGFLKQGVLRSLFSYIDKIATERNWLVQGLGVWIDNYSAIAAYERLGFAKAGEPQESTRKPGLYYQRMIRSAAK
jgi:RimJ/RimL family protein N-acetyltransferase